MPRQTRPKRLRSLIRAFASVACAFLIALSAMSVLARPAYAQAPQSRFADVNGVRLHYLVAAKATR